MVPNLCCSIVGLDVYVMQPSAHSERMALVVTLILTVVAFRMSMTERLPTLPYLTLLDKWLLAMFAVFFLAAVESIGVFFLATHFDDPALARRVDVAAFTSSLVYILLSTATMLCSARWRGWTVLAVTVAATAATTATFPNWVQEPPATFFPPS